MSTATGIEDQQSKSIFKAVPAVRSLVWFNIFNAISFNIAMSTPMILLVKRWGASNLYIGTLTATMWLMATMQLYMAPRVEYIGFRKLLLAGWTSRTVVLMVVCVLPFFSTPDNHVLLLWITLICMTLYSFLRGAATTAYMPWIRLLIGPKWRGRYFSLEQSVSNLSAAATLFFCGIVMVGNHEISDIQYGWILVISGLAGWISIFFLKSADAPAPLAGRPKIEPITKWMPRVFEEKEFRHQIFTAIAFYMTIGAFPIYTQILMKDRLHYTDSLVMIIMGFNMSAIVLSAWFWGYLADRFGSRPIMSLATWVLLVLLGFWLLMTLGVVPTSPWLLGAFFMLHGIGYNGFHISNQRLMLNIAPKRFPVLAVATIQVFVSLSLGVSPILWGGALDFLHGMKWRIVGYEVNQYTVFYAVSIVMMIGAKWMIRRLPNAHGALPLQVLSYVMLEYPAQTIRGLFGAEKK